SSTLSPYTTLFRSVPLDVRAGSRFRSRHRGPAEGRPHGRDPLDRPAARPPRASGGGTAGRGGGRGRPGRERHHPAHDLRGRHRHRCTARLTRARGTIDPHPAEDEPAMTMNLLPMATQDLRFQVTRNENAKTPEERAAILAAPGF